MGWIFAARRRPRMAAQSNGHVAPGANNNNQWLSWRFALRWRRRRTHLAAPGKLPCDVNLSENYPPICCIYMHASVWAGRRRWLSVLTIGILHAARMPPSDSTATMIIEFYFVEASLHCICWRGIIPAGIKCEICYDLTGQNQKHVCKAHFSCVLNNYVRLRAFDVFKNTLM